MSIYLDNNATTPLRPEVWDAMAAVEFGGAEARNPSSTHKSGQAAKKVMRAARERVADALGADPDEIIFTGGGSEAINLALKGSVWASGLSAPHIVTTAIEHHAVLNTVAWLETQGCSATVVPADLRCRVDPQAIADAITRDTLIVSVMLANNEVGTIQPVREIGAICRERGVLLHVDAVQGVGKLPVDVDDLNCDLLSCTAHKIGGPKGVGALYVRKGITLVPVIHGGGQESGIRSGTQNVAGIAGFAEAVELAEQEREETWARWRDCRQVLFGLQDEMNAVRVNSDPEICLPNCLSITFLYCDAMALTTNLSMRGIYVSTGSACSSGDLEPSHVLKAMGLSDVACHCTVRFSLGWSTTRDQVDTAVGAVKELVEMLREVTMPEELGKCGADCPCFVKA